MIQRRLGFEGAGVDAAAAAGAPEARATIWLRSGMIDGSRLEYAEASSSTWLRASPFCVCMAESFRWPLTSRDSWTYQRTNPRTPRVPRWTAHWSVLWESEDFIPPFYPADAAGSTANSITWPGTGTTTSAPDRSVRRVSAKANDCSSSPWMTVILRMFPVIELT